MLPLTFGRCASKHVTLTSSEVHLPDASPQFLHAVHVQIATDGLSHSLCQREATRVWLTHARISRYPC